MTGIPQRVWVTAGGTVYSQSSPNPQLTTCDESIHMLLLMTEVPKGCNGLMVYIVLQLIQLLYKHHPELNKAWFTI